MARAQQGGVVRGGGIDPYVAQASLQRSDARNRMKETMVKEQGATKRQGMQGDAQVAQANIQAGAQKQAMDAELAAREEGRREDHEFKMQEQELTDSRTVERDKILSELRMAEDQNAIDRVSELYMQAKSEERLEQIAGATQKDISL